MNAKTSALQLDPVCGIEIPTTSAYRVTRNGEDYCFCSNGCRQLFLRHPSEYSVVETRPRTALTAAPAPAARRILARAPERSEASWTRYVPLAALVDVALLVACAKQLAHGGDFDGMTWMQDFIGLCFVLLAMVRFFDLQTFAYGFRSFDVLANSIHAYGYVYPFLELSLGLAYLANWRPVVTNGVTLGLMIFGLLGVVRAAWRGVKVDGAGSNHALRLPLSTVAGCEYVLMATLAAAMLLGFES